MGQHTAIAWTDHTFNPWIGCTPVSPGCAHCYAETLMDHRLGRVRWGKGQARVRTSQATWAAPLRWNLHAALRADGYRPRVFCASLADVFDPEVPDAWRDDLFDLIGQCRNLDWQILTKRPENIEAYLDGYGRRKRVDCWFAGSFTSSKYTRKDSGISLPHVWLGVSVENQKTADERIPILLQLPNIIWSAIRFVSAEPMLESIFLPSGLHWVIAGGESGPKARPCSIIWLQQIVDRCWHLGIPCFVKQLGSLTPEWHHKDKQGTDTAQWPEGLRVQEFP
jgi:protein gp37